MVGPYKYIYLCLCSLNVGNLLTSQGLIRLCSRELVPKVTTFCFSCKNRPALNVMLQPNIPSVAKPLEVAKLPGVHYFEMIEDVSRVGTKFGNWYLACT